MVLLLCSQYAGTEHSREFTGFFGVEWLINEMEKTNIFDVIVHFNASPRNCELQGCELIGKPEKDHF